MQLAHEVSLKEVEIKARQSPESSNNGGRIPAVHTGEKRIHIPKDLVSSFVVGDDIDNWFEAIDVALAMHRVSEEDWGVSLWKHASHREGYTTEP